MSDYGSGAGSHGSGPGISSPSHRLHTTAPMEWYAYSADCSETIRVPAASGAPGGGRRHVVLGALKRSQSRAASMRDIASRAASKRTDSSTGTLRGSRVVLVIVDPLIDGQVRSRSMQHDFRS